MFNDRNFALGTLCIALVGHVDLWDPETAARLKQWTAHFLAQGADATTAGRRALAMIYRGAVEQAQVLAYMDDFWMMAIIFMGILPLIPLMKRVRPEDNVRARESPGRVEALPAPEE